MNPFDDYKLLDFWDGRRLERFGPLVIERPCPAAEGVPKGGGAAEKSSFRERADIRFLADSASGKSGALGERGEWEALTEKGREFFFENGDGDAGASAAVPKSWTIRHAAPDFTLELKGSPFGHLGVFPEQSENWGRIFSLCSAGEKKLGRPLRVLNLFAYTGASSLAAAAGGAAVVHLDAARNIVERAKRNAELSGLSERVRFIADDAVKFVRREKKRGNFYDGVILDPPTYGHGARGEVWRLPRDLPGLLDDLFLILSDDFPFLLLTCHTDRFDGRSIARLLTERMEKRFESASKRFRIDSGPIRILSARKKELSAGEGGLLYCKTAADFL